MSSDLKLLTSLVTTTYLPKEGDTAELVNEHDPEGEVVVKRADGTPVMTMPQYVWNLLKDFPIKKPDEPDEPDDA